MVSSSPGSTQFGPRNASKMASPHPSSDRQHASDIGHVCRACAAGPAAAQAPTERALRLSKLMDAIHAALRSAQLQLVSIFRAADADEDGNMTPAELRAHMGKLGAELSADEAALVVDALDTDRDGGLSAAEFLAYMKGYRPGQLTRPQVSPMQRISLAWQARVGGYVPAADAALYAEVWRGLCEWLNAAVLRGARCRVKGWCRVVYVQAWRARVGGRRRAAHRVPLLLLEPEWAAAHGLSLRQSAVPVAADERAGQPVTVR
eukprot:COSAG04_NODE_2366_length_4262_cov_66.150613_2_plen_262_part_00